MEKYKMTSNSWYSLLAEMVLDDALEKFKKEILYQQIDETLENKDKERFLSLSREWVKLHSEE